MHGSKRVARRQAQFDFLRVTRSGYTYDASGDMLTDGTNTYTWNGEGQLKSAASVNYTYDGDGKRVEKSSGTYYWFSPSGTPLAETDASGNTQNEYVYFSAGRTARRDSAGNVYYYFSDAIGTAQLITNSTGTVCYDSNKTPFGYEMAYTTTCAQNYMFAGMERDSETGNDHTWFRNYEQNLGRWMSPDLLSGDVSNPQSLNRYTYALNNPTTLTDPLGLQSPGENCMSKTTFGSLVDCVTGVYCMSDPGQCSNRLLYGMGGIDFDTMAGQAMGDDIFSAIMGEPGTYLAIDMYGNLSYGFSTSLWQQAYALTDYLSGLNRPVTLLDGTVIGTEKNLVSVDSLITIIKSDGLSMEVDSPVIDYYAANQAMANVFLENKESIDNFFAWMKFNPAVAQQIYPKMFADFNAALGQVYAAWGELGNGLEVSPPIFTPVPTHP
jgi:RHS repeat-associated protein